MGTKVKRVTYTLTYSTGWKDSVIFDRQIDSDGVSTVLVYDKSLVLPYLEADVWETSVRHAAVVKRYLSKRGFKIVK